MAFWAKEIDLFEETDLALTAKETDSLWSRFARFARDRLASLEIDLFEEMDLDLVIKEKMEGGISVRKGGCYTNPNVSSLISCFHPNR